VTWYYLEQRINDLPVQTEDEPVLPFAGNSACYPELNAQPNSDSYAIEPCGTEEREYHSDLKAVGTVYGGLLNRRVICGTLPEYASDAQNVSEVVLVDVLISANGNVIRARANKGPRLLEASAIKAARTTYFGPTLLGGEGVNVRGVLRYKFDAERGVSLPR
jgi:hypothetical protein